MLAEFVRTPPRESGTCYYFRTVTHPEFSRYREHFYFSNRKVVPLALLDEQFTELSLAVWLMDDGAGSIVSKCDSIRSRSHYLRMKRYRVFCELNLELKRVSIEIKIAVVCASLTPALSD